MADSQFSMQVPEADAGCRLDTFVSRKKPSLSRSRAAALISEGSIRVDGMEKKPGYRIRADERISGRIPPPVPVLFAPEPIPLEILHEDADLIVVNKPSGLVVHPAPGHAGGTLVNALLHRCSDLKGIGGELRPGIVHRLDKDTSGVLVVAKTEAAQQHLAGQFKARSVRKQYLALVQGRFDTDSGWIDLPVGRHPVHRKKMSTRSRKGRTAQTGWVVAQRLGEITLLRLEIKTGRTHQIRVHLSAVGRPVVGDPVYGSRLSASKTSTPKPGRQMLHAWRLEFAHPATGERLLFEAPLPEDFRQMLEKIRATEPQ